jgi:SET domain
MCCSKKCEEILEIERGTKPKLHPRPLSKALAICGGSFTKLKQLLIDPELSNKTIFDFDLSNPDDPLYKYHLLLAVNGLSMHHNSHINVTLPVQPFQNEENDKVAKDFMIRFCRIVRNNCFDMEWMVASKSQESSDSKLLGSGIFPFGSLLNHSCISNIDAQIVDNKFVYIVRLPISNGEQLFVSYFG